MDYNRLQFFKNNRLQWQNNQIPGLNFTSLMDYKGLFVSRESIIMD